MKPLDPGALLRPLIKESLYYERFEGSWEREIGCVLSVMQLSSRRRELHCFLNKESQVKLILLFCRWFLFCWLGSQVSESLFSWWFDSENLRYELQYYDLCSDHTESLKVEARMVVQEWESHAKRFGKMIERIMPEIKRTTLQKRSWDCIAWWLWWTSQRCPDDRKTTHNSNEFMMRMMGQLLYAMTTTMLLSLLKPLVFTHIVHSLPTMHSERGQIFIEKDRKWKLEIPVVASPLWLRHSEGTSKGHSEGTSANAAVVFLDVSSYYCPSSWWGCSPPVFVSIITSEMKFPLLWSLSVIILTVCRSRTKVSRVSLHFTDFSTLSWNTHSRQHRHPSDSRDESETRSFSCHQQGDQVYSVTNLSCCICLCSVVVASDAFL